MIKIYGVSILFIGVCLSANVAFGDSNLENKSKLGLDIESHTQTLEQSRNQMVESVSLDEIFFGEHSHEMSLWTKCGYKNVQIKDRTGMQELVCDHSGVLQISGQHPYPRYLLGPSAKNVTSGGGYFMPSTDGNSFRDVTVNEDKKIRTYSAKINYGSENYPLDAELKFHKKLKFFCAMRVNALQGGKFIGYDVCQIKKF